MFQCWSEPLNLRELPWKALQKTEEATQDVSISLAGAKEVSVDAAVEAKERKSIPFFSFQ